MHTPQLIRELNGGTQQLYRFDNGYGASVVRHEFSYGSESGLWELAVLKFIGPDIDNYVLVYDTPITYDVIGRLPYDEVEGLLNEIANLEPVKGEN